MKMPLTMLAMLAMFATVVTIIATVLVLAVFGLGKALSLVLPLSAFEASLLSMLALLPALLAVWRIVAFSLPYDIRHTGADEEDDDDDDDDVYEDGSDEGHDEGDRVVWAAPMRQVISALRVGRNSPCPCGSGKKYKRCCGKGDRPVRQAVSR